MISRSSSSRYECQPPDLKQVGRELGVRYAVEGSVRRAQDRVRITAQLIDATTDVHVWSESYERDLSPSNMFDIQSDIARQIANALEVQILDRAGQRPTLRVDQKCRREFQPRRVGFCALVPLEMLPYTGNPRRMAPRTLPNAMDS